MYVIQMELNTSHFLPNSPSFTEGSFKNRNKNPWIGTRFTCVAVAAHPFIIYQKDCGGLAKSHVQEVNKLLPIPPFVLFYSFSLLPLWKYGNA